MRKRNKAAALVLCLLFLFSGSVSAAAADLLPSLNAASEGESRLAEELPPAEVASSSDAQEPPEESGGEEAAESVQEDSLLSSFPEAQISPENTPEASAAEPEIPGDLPSEEPAESEMPETFEEPVLQLPQTAEFTQAGPFLPPVWASAAKGLLTQELPAADDNGLELTKTAFTGPQGELRLRLEAYTTGRVTSTVRTVPADIVLVLDQSGSMADNFAGESTTQNTSRRQYALKRAVNQFLDQINLKYTQASDHRVSIVTFSDRENTKTLCGWTDLDNAGKDSLQSAVTGLPDQPQGATRIDEGMACAQRLMEPGGGYFYTGGNSQRHKVVIVFTDGVPTDTNVFKINVADSALSCAKAIKDAGATVYGIGIFGGADSGQLYGEHYYSGFWSQSDCSGDVGARWGYNLSLPFGAGSYPDPDIAAANRFMNYLSSNFAANCLGAERRTPLFGQYWEITEVFDRQSSLYYLTTGNEAGLTHIFETIEENISNPDISLTADTVLRDVLSREVKLPEGLAAADIRVQTAARLVDGSWAQPQDFAGAQVTAQDQTVEVAGFDYNANFVSAEPRDGNFYGQKLVVEFPIEANYANTFGGNGIESNTADSAIYSGGNPVEAFPIPRVNLPIRYEIAAQDQSVYLGNAAVLADTLRFAGGYMPDGMNNRAVSILYSLKKEDSVLGTCTLVPGAVQGSWEWQSAAPDGEDWIWNCQSYTLECRVTSSEVPDSAGAPAADLLLAGEEASHPQAHIWSPAITLQDRTLYLGESVPLEELYQIGGSWADRNGHSDAPEVSGARPDYTVRVIGECPYGSGDSPHGQIEAQGNVGHLFTPLAAGNYHFKLAVQSGETDITAFCRLSLPECAEEDHPADRHFSVHVKAGSLTVRKRFEKRQDVNQAVIVRITRESAENDRFPAQRYSYRTALIPDEHGEYSAVLTNLPLGQYTVTEESGWSWRYAAASSVTAEITAENPRGQAELINHLQTAQWLGGQAEACVNSFADRQETAEPGIDEELYQIPVTMP